MDLYKQYKKYVTYTQFQTLYTRIFSNEEFLRLYKYYKSQYNDNTYSFVKKIQEDEFKQILLCDYVIPKKLRERRLLRKTMRKFKKCSIK